MALRLADDWLVVASPPSAADMAAVPVAQPRPDELDHALVRLAGAPSGAMLADDRPRG